MKLVHGSRFAFSSSIYFVVGVITRLAEADDCGLDA
jgi:hypothetical protein